MNVPNHGGGSCGARRRTETATTVRENVGRDGELVAVPSASLPPGTSPLREPHTVSAEYSALSALTIAQAKVRFLRFC
jgi:hypothetical protein